MEEVVDQPPMEEDSNEPSYEEYPTDMPEEWETQSSAQHWDEEAEHESQMEYHASMILNNEQELSPVRRVYMTKYVHAPPEDLDIVNMSKEQPTYDHRL